MARITKNPEERRNEILDTAERLFTNAGYDKTSTTDIAKTMKVAQGTLYYYFESKDALADALIDRQQQQILEQFTAIACHSQLNAYQKLAWIFIFELDDPTGHIEKFSYLRHMNNAVLRQKQHIRMIGKFTPLVTEIIHQGNREQFFQVENPSLTAEFFLTTFHHWVDSSLFDWTKEERYLRIQAIQPILEQLFGIKPGSFELHRLRETAAAIEI